MPRGRSRKTQGDVLVKSAEMIGWAIGGIEREIMSTRERLAALSAQANSLRSRLPGGSVRGAAAAAAATAVDAVEGAAVKAKRRRRKMSAEGRKRISDMMKKRWAEHRKAKTAKTTKAAKTAR
ncbi:hypothetical protein BH24ACI5_BH24ACI5_21130 [soil metagenome]